MSLTSLKKNHGIFKAEFVRSATVGLTSTIANLATLGFLIELLDWSQQAANVPSMVVGSAVQFFGHRHFVFAAKAGKMSRQGTLFILGEGIGLLLNSLGFWIATESSTWHYAVLRVVVTFLVYVIFNYPYWKMVVFKR